MQNVIARFSKLTLPAPGSGGGEGEGRAHVGFLTDVF